MSRRHISLAITSIIVSVEPHSSLFDELRPHVVFSALYKSRGRLAATFFFWRKTGDRDDIDKLVATLTYQIARKIPLAVKQMEEALKNFGVPLPELSLDDQLSTLLIRGPVAPADPTGPNLIVIDGLDECTSRDGIIRLINYLRKNRLPFRFLLTSRPEPDIKACFAYHPGGRLSLSLTESKDDIRKYFVEELEKIRQHHLPSCSPSDWPPNPYFDELVKKSEGLFVYASTAVSYIGGKGYPEERLQDVLKLHKGLDSLYDQVIREAKEWDHFDIVMGSLLYLRYQLTVNELSTVLLNVDSRLHNPVICSALGGCHSILTIPPDFDAKIKFYHASLQDFLTDQFRSGSGSPFPSPTVFYAPAMSHVQLLVGCLKAITRAFNNGTLAPKYALVSWYYHASLFLSAPHTSEGLGELRDQEAKELVKKIDLKWVKSWMVQALGWAGVPYLIQQLPLKEVRSCKCRDSSVMIQGQGYSRHRLDSTPGAEVKMYL